MDPNANLEEQRRLVQELLTCDHLEGDDFCEDCRTCHLCANAAARLAELALALDEWISKGGFLPRDWHRAQTDGSKNP